MEMSNIRTSDDLDGAYGSTGSPCTARISAHPDPSTSSGLKAQSRESVLSEAEGSKD
jgi:hypothetical protein